MNALYASYLGVPIAFLSGDKRLTEIVKEANENIFTVVTKEGAHGAVISEHPQVTNERIRETVKQALTSDLSKNIVPLPKHFEVEIKYKQFNNAYSASFYPGCKLKDSETVVFEADDYYEVVRALKFIL
jgi:D-amino peptidase